MIVINFHHSNASTIVLYMSSTRLQSFSKIRYW